jgi:hypothetical protein
MRNLPGGLLALFALSLACAGGPEATTTPGSPPEPSASTSAAPQAPPASPSAAPQAAPATSASVGRPLYYERVLTPADLDGRTLRELSLMRNTIFARVGQPFVKPWLNAWFRAQPWYVPAEVQDLSRMSDADRANVPLITAKEQSFSRTELLAMADAIRARGAVSAEDQIELQLISAALGEWAGSASVPVAERNPLEDPTVLDTQLVLAQVEGLSRRDLRLLRNTVYARRGRPFKSDVLQQYFADKAWYAERADYSDALLTEVDKRNIALVQSMEDRLGGPMKEWEHQKEDGWFEGA